MCTLGHTFFYVIEIRQSRMVLDFSKSTAFCLLQTKRGGPDPFISFLKHYYKIFPYQIWSYKFSLSNEFCKNYYLVVKKISFPFRSSLIHHLAKLQDYQRHNRWLHASIFVYFFKLSADMSASQLVTKGFWEKKLFLRNSCLTVGTARYEADNLGSETKILNSWLTMA